MVSADVECKVFEQFVVLLPDFAGRRISWSPGANPPDFVCVDDNGMRVGVELSEWLDEEQISSERPQYQREEEFLQVIASKTSPPPKNIGKIMFFEHDGIRLRPTDAQAFRKELYEFVDSLDANWQTFDGHDESTGVDIDTDDLAAYSMLAKYTHSLGCTGQQYDSSTLGDEWIAFMSHGGFYSPDTAKEALDKTLVRKTSKYATLHADENLSELYLLIYYDQGFCYNTPFGRPDEGFPEIAAHLHAVASHAHGSFDRIFLFVPATNDIAVIYVH